MKQSSLLLKPKKLDTKFHTKYSRLRTANIQNFIFFDIPNLLSSYVQMFFLKNNKRGEMDLKNPEKREIIILKYAKKLIHEILRPIWGINGLHIWLYLKQDDVPYIFKLLLPTDKNHHIFVSRMVKMKRNSFGFEDIDGELMLNMNDLSWSMVNQSIIFKIFTMDKSYVPVIGRLIKRGFEVEIYSLKEKFVSKELRNSASRCFSLLPSIRRFK